jgi:amino acid adenylation domain-containing protein/non-ribosomal peptide synthase protein (TIGR01720 family)
MRNFLSELRQSDISVRLVDGDLSIKFPKGKPIEPRILEEIKLMKHELLEYLAALERTGYEDIPAAPVQESYPLSSSQRRLWILSQLEEGSQAYHIGGAYEFSGKLNTTLLEAALKTLISRHEVLRTVFRQNAAEEVRQFILTPGQLDFNLQLTDLRNEADAVASAKVLLQEDARKPFDLSAGPLLRARLIQTAAEQYIFSFVMHHIITDGWSMELLIKEVLTFYNAFASGKESPLPPLRIQYKDYSVWQQQQLSGANLKRHKDYWLDRFRGELPLLDLAVGKLRPAVKTYNGATISKQIDATTAEALKALSREADVTMFMSTMAAVNVLLYYYSGQEDIIAGSPVAGRDHADLENQIGFYLNTLALRTQFNGSDSFSDLLHNTKRTLLGAYEHQVYPFDELVENLSLKRDMSRNALFDVMVVYLNEELSGRQPAHNLGDLTVKPLAAGDENIAKFDLTFSFSEAGGKLKAYIEYNTDIYTAEAAQALLTHLEQVLAAVIAEPLTPLNELEWMSAEERQTILSSFNDTAFAYPADATVISMFEEQVKATPEKIALQVNDLALTYAALNEQANKLACWLRDEFDIHPGDLVGIKLERSEWLIITMLGVLKSGAAYVPIDPAYPAERISYLQADSSCRVTVDETALTRFREVSAQYPAQNPVRLHIPEDLAYVIYTSGSTGKPKGVMIEHKSLAAFLVWCKKEFLPLDVDAVFAVTSVCFDLSVYEIFFPLVAGKQLRLLKDGLEIPQYLHTQGKILVNTVPSVVKILVDEGVDLSNVTVLNLGGEAAVPAYVDILAASHLVLINVYGPTEATVYATSLQMNPGWRLNIGRPIANTEIYIVNERHHLCPIGVPGEICIGGKGLARGYLNRPELTAKSFVANPFRSGERMYKTGDIGRWLPDGTIDCYGRKDQQVKIRGYRIEPGEIEKALLTHAGIDAAVVVARDNKAGQKELVAYIAGPAKPNAYELTAYLGSKLPDYMIPARYVQLDALPLTANGKVDKLSLPDPQGVELAAGTEYIAPRTEVESHLAAVWQQVLVKEHISVKDNFFVSGGDSIKSIQVVSRLKQRGYSITIRDIMLHPVLEALALKAKTVVRVADQSTVQGIVPLSPVQRRFFELYPTGNHHYNQCIVLGAKTALSADALEKALHKLVQHHDALRMVYRHAPEGWVQENKGADLKPSFEVITVAGKEEFTHECNRIQQSMNLQEGPLFKAALIRGLEHDQLVLVAHHLIIDGISWRILMEDIEALYHKRALPLKTDSFHYWQQQQAAYASSAALRKEQEWWQAADAGYPLPLDYKEGSNSFGDVAGASIQLDEQMTGSLINRCYAAYRTGINDILLTGLSLALKEVFGLEKALIKLEGHGRENIMDADVSRTAGWFTTMYPVVLDMQYSHDPLQQLVAVKEYLHRVPNKGIGYGILQYFGGMQFTARPEITFNYLGEFGNGAQPGALFAFSGLDTGVAISGDMQRDCLLEVSGLLADGKMNLAIAYSNKQFATETMNRLAHAYKKHLQALVLLLSTETTQHLTPVDCTYKGLSVAQLQLLNANNDVEDVYPLSPLQEGFFYHWTVSPASSFYFDQVHYRLTGKIDIAIVQKSYALLVERHAVLRTAFTRQFGERVLQVVRKHVQSEFIYREVSNAPAGWLEQYKQEDINRGFDLYTGSQMRLSVLAFGSDVYEFIWSHHHILMDGWCTGILISEFFQICNALATATEPALGKVDPYSTYIDWLERQDQQASLEYWRNYLAGYESVAVIPTKDVIEPGVHTSAERTFSLGEQLTQAIKTLCVQKGITENTFLQTIWGILLGKYNNTSDVVFGIVVSGRPGEVEGIEQMIGLFINSIPTRVNAPAGTSVAELLKEVQLASVESAPHHYTQLADIQAETELVKDLFNHLVQFQNFPVQEMVKQSVENTGDEKSLSIEFASFFAENDFDFTVIVSPGNNFELRLMYNGNLYDELQIGRIEGHLTQIIRQVVANPNLLVEDIVCLTEAEEQEQLITFNATHTDYPRESTIAQLFEAQVKLTPANNALVAGAKTLSYQLLNEQANQLAHYLRKNNDIQPNDIVAIKLEKRELVVVAILAVLKAGGAYLPLDPEYPESRISYMVQDSKCKLLLDDEEWSMFNTQRSRYSKENPVAVNTSRDLAYVIYTSGSTGKPKGVMVEHRSLVNLACWQNQALNVTATDRTTLYLGVAFDAAVMELFPNLIAGACLYTIPKETRLDAARLAKFFDDNQVTIAALPAQMAEQFMEQENHSLRYLIAGGDKLTAVNGKNYAVVNQYGPTENTVVSTCFVVEKQRQCKRPSIGKPVSNVQAFILNAQKRLQPVGVAGELFVGGESLARGYLNNEELTAEKFIANPYAPATRLYRTGDICRWLPNGNIEFIGRTDEQVKIRGFRIELGEIENALLGYEKISSAVTVAKTDAHGEKALVAYVVGKEELNIAEIKTYLKALLPDYMIPPHFVQLDVLPLNVNGKLDKDALPDPVGLESTAAKKYVAPRTATERKLVEIWEDVLGRKGIGVTHDFFESGGHSLRATRLSSQIHKKLNAELPLSDIFANSVLEAQAALIESIHKTTYSSIQPVPVQDGYELSASQRRLWILSQLDTANIAYNIPGFYEFKGELNRDALEHSFTALIERHEILRTVFKENAQGEVKQYVLANAPFSIAYEEAHGAGAETLHAILHKEATTPFDLASGPLLRVKLVRIAENVHLFSYVMHHIISDGWSMQVMIKELLALYNAFAKGLPQELPPLRIQYKDFSAWQLQQLQGDNLASHKTYWLNQVAGEIPVLELPTDNPRPAVKTFNGFTIEKTFNREICAELKKVSQLQGGTLFMSLLAAVNALLYKYTGQQDIIIGTPVAGREHADLEDQIGFYINTLALRTRFSGRDSFLSLLNNTKHITLGAFDHQVYPFDDLVDQLSPRRDMSRNPIFDVFIVLQNTGLTSAHAGNEAANPSLGISKYTGKDDGISKFDLTFDFTEMGEELVLNLQYNSDLFSKSSMNNLLQHMERLFNAVITAPQTALAEINLLGEEEKDKLIHQFNFRKSAYPQDKTIAGLFEEQAARTPDNLAVCFGNIAITYASLDEQANRFAAYLQANYNLSADELVAIQLERSEWMIIAMLGVLKAGGAYLPIDPAYPQERIQFMLDDSKAKLLVDEKELSAFRQQAGKFEGAKVQRTANAANLVYVIYTSGSTGRPKGVMVEHRGLANTVLAQIELFDVKGTDRCLQFASFSFDAFAWESFIALLSGASLTIIGAEERRNPELFTKFINDHSINIITLSPAYLRQLDLRLLPNLKVLVSAGEAAQYELFGGLANKAVAYNAYGPTEASICGTIFNLGAAEGRPGQNVPIGSAISNARIYVLDEHGQLVPENVPGEICIAGPGVARGYLNRPELTNEKFVADPFFKGEHMYRTGDLGRWRPQGNLEYIGRKDGQVKIRGHRIEPGEIENALRKHEQVQEAAVIVTSAAQEKELVAYVVATQELGTQTLRSWLTELLPAYMIPAYFVQLDSLPVTVNGKLDRNSLPDPASVAAAAEYVAPSNQLEEKLVAIWQQVLNRKDIGVTDNFFAAGGNSIKIIQLSRLISQQLNAPVSVGVLFQYANIRDLVDHINQNTTKEDESIGQDELISELDKFNFDDND